MCFFCSLRGKSTKEEGSSGRKSYDLNTLPLNAALWDLPTPCQRFQKKKSTVLEITWNTDGTVQRNSTGKLRDIPRKQIMAGRKKQRSFCRGMHMNIWHQGPVSSRLCHVLCFNPKSLLLVLSLRLVRHYEIVCACVSVGLFV